MNTPLVSINMPVWNAENTIIQTVKSLLSQTYTNFELIILDDGSTDNTVSLIKSLNDSRIKLFVDGKNKKTAARRNEALELSKGKYIAVMDSDDISYPKRLEEQVKYLEEHPDVDLLGTEAIVFNDNEGVISVIHVHKKHDEICSKPWNGFYLIHPTWMAKKDWYLKYKYMASNIICAEDQDLLFRAFSESKFANLDMILLGYRRDKLSLAEITKKVIIPKYTYLKSVFKKYLEKGEYIFLFLSLLVQLSKIATYYLAYFIGIEKILLKHLFVDVDEQDKKKFEKVIDDLS